MKILKENMLRFGTKNLQEQQSISKDQAATAAEQWYKNLETQVAAINTYAKNRKKTWRLMYYPEATGIVWRIGDFSKVGNPAVVDGGVGNREIFGKVSSGVNGTANSAAPEQRIDGYLQTAMDNLVTRLERTNQAPPKPNSLGWDNEKDRAYILTQIQKVANAAKQVNFDLVDKQGFQLR
jgi:hypothetical protein